MVLCGWEGYHRYNINNNNNKLINNNNEAFVYSAIESEIQRRCWQHCTGRLELKR